MLKYPKRKQLKEASIEEIPTEDDSSSDISEKEESDKLKEEFTEESEEENFISEEQDFNTEEQTEVLPIDDQLEEEPELSTDLTETEISEKPTDEDPDLAKSKLEEETFDDLELEEPKDEQSETEKEEETSTEVLIGEGSSTVEEPEELDLGLPAPEETLRESGRPACRRIHFFTTHQRGGSYDKKSTWGHDHCYCKGYDWYWKQTLCPRRRSRFKLGRRSGNEFFWKLASGHGLPLVRMHPLPFRFTVTMKIPTKAENMK